MGLFKRLLRWARVTAAGSDDRQFPVQQIEYMGKVSDAVVVFPYGIHGNVTPDALALMFAIQGDDSNRAVIAGTPKDRPKMAAGENCIYHPPSGNIIHFLQSGDINIIASGNLNINAQSVTIDAALTTFTGNVQIDGTLNVDGGITTPTATIGGKEFATHAHSGVETGAGNTGPVV